MTARHALTVACALLLVACLTVWIALVRSNDQLWRLQTWNAGAPREVPADATVTWMQLAPLARRTTGEPMVPPWWQVANFANAPGTLNLLDVELNGEPRVRVEARGKKLLVHVPASPFVRVAIENRRAAVVDDGWTVRAWRTMPMEAAR